MPKKSRADRLDRWVRKVQPHIAYCVNCQPYDEGVVWVLGDPIDLADLLRNLDVPEDLHEEVARCLHCDNCGSADLDLGSEVAQPTLDDLLRREFWARLQAKHLPDIDSFQQHLQRVPYLGAAHRVGRRIHKLIRQSEAISLAAGKWWRARSPDGSRRFGPEDMVPPSTGVASEGRFTHFGKAALYLSATPATAMRELLSDGAESGLFWLQQFELEERSDVLDLTSPPGYEDWYKEELLVAVTHRAALAGPRDAVWHPEYLLPRFVADCARDAGFGAILFSSARSAGRNLVVLAWPGEGVRPSGDPESRVHITEPDPF